MVSPMREKRTWPPQDKDSDGETVAAFEAAVAVVKETVVRSGEVLVSAKEDLHDHQRWLKAQTAKVQADRTRHDRFLHRQRERQETLLRREQKRERRRAKRQAAARSIKDAVSAAIYAVRSAVSSAIYAVRSAVSSAIYAVRSAVWLVVAKTIAGLNSIDAAAAYGLRWLWGWARYGALYVAVHIQRGASFAGGAARSLTLRLWSLLSAGVAAIGAKAHAAAPSVGNFLSLCFGGVAARTRDVSGAIGRGLGAGLSGLSAKADVLMRQAGEALGPAMASIAARTHALAPAMASIAARTHALAPSLTERIGQARQAAGHYARGGALRVQSLLARSKEAPAAEGAYAAPVVAGAYAAPAAESENAVSLPPAVGRFDLSQMLIIAGALLLICGGLMLGGGLMLRAKTPAPLVAASASEPIAWLFEHPSLPLDERSVFVFDPTPDGLRIKGFAIGGVNLSEETLGALGGVIKPDGRDQDLDLALSVEKLEGDADGAQSESVAVLAEGAIPPQAPFRLVYLFPAEGANGGLTSQQVISTYGGVLLKVRYEMEGKQRSFIQYLPTSLLEEQLAEILASVKGS